MRFPGLKNEVFRRGWGPGGRGGSGGRGWGQEEEVGQDEEVGARIQKR